ncbi:hypothetical protein ACSBR1_015909 [Camellia fascicularis]
MRREAFHLCLRCRPLLGCRPLVPPSSCSLSLSWQFQGFPIWLGATKDLRF